MLVRRYEPFNDIRRSFDLVNQIINSVEKSVDTAPAGELVDFIPKVNTREDENAYYIEVELPGVNKEDVDIKVDGNVLTVSGERKIKEEVKEEDYYKVESKYGTFSRSFTLPEKVDVANIQAESQDGIIEIVIPKLKVDTSSKKIEIK
jgi:HSP20 family protein